MEKPYSVLLYYCYTPIEDPASFREEHHLLCLDLNLRGRIIVAHEGLNGTVSGLAEDCQLYMEHLRKDPRFKDIEFKIDQHDSMAFQKLHVRVKEEIVHSSLLDVDPNKSTAKYIKPEELKKLKDDEDVVIVDLRSNYEHSLGKFKNSVTLDIDNFRDFPKLVDSLSEFKDKKVITVCTGGIKCEKGSAFLVKKGFKDVYKLHGGIINYGKETDGEDFEGSCYVFDNRLSTQINEKNPKVISACFVCKASCDRMVNCANPLCNIHVPMCEACGEKMDGACSEACKNHPKKRPYNKTGYYAKESNGYDPRKGAKRKKKKDDQQDD